MPTNPFRRKGTQRGSTPPTTTRSTNYSRNAQKSGSGGLRIAASGNTAAAAPPTTTRGNGIVNDVGTSPQSPVSAPLLPPESDYRTSLIMPHLTKRFTLLRAPDGTMVTPDAMRAHLRAQRARARATGVPGTQCFLTEEEEDEIIDQLKRQTRMEEMDEWNYSQARRESSTPADSLHFGGTDGFGTWTNPSADQHSRTDSRIDSSLTESLGGALQSSASTSSRDGGSGGFFTSRSSTSRDLAYMREVERSRAAKRDGEQPNLTTAFEDAGGSATHDGQLPLVQEEEDDGAVDEPEEKESALDDASPLDPPDAEVAHDPDVSMPGDFLAAEQRQSARLSVSDIAASRKSSDTSTLTTRPQHARQSTLLTTLTPEAFNRVSSALEELYEMVQGRVSEGEEEEDVEEKRETSSSDRGEPLSLASVGTSGNDIEEEEEELDGGGDDDAVAVYRRRRTPITPDADAISLPKTSIDEGSTRIRASIDSETNSFTSARSDVNPSALGIHTHARAEAFAGIGAAAMTVGTSSVSPLPVTPAGWQVSPASAKIPLANEERPAFARKPKSSLTSLGGESSLQSQSSGGSPAPRSAPLVSLDPANGRTKIDRSPTQQADAVQADGAAPSRDSLRVQDPERTPVAPTFRSPINSFMSNSSAGPLSAGFQIGGMAPSDRAAAAAAATAAGVAASNFVAQAQKEQRDRRTITPTLAPASPPKSEITVGAMPDDAFNTHHVPEPSEEVQITPTTPDLNVGQQAIHSPVLSAGAIAARSPRYFPAASRQSMRTYAAGFHPSSVPMPTSEATQDSAAKEAVGEDVPSTLTAKSAQGGLQPTLQSSALLPEPPLDAEEGFKWRERYGMASADARSIRSGTSFHISEDEDADDEAQDDEEEDVWARVARNTSPKVEPRRISALQGGGAGDGGADAVNGVRTSKGMTKSGSGMSLDALAQMQNDLVRSASALRNGSLRTRGLSSPPPSIPSYPPPAPPPQSPPPDAPRPTSSGSQARSVEVPLGCMQKSTSESDPNTNTELAKSTDSASIKLEKARAKARTIAEQRATPPKESIAIPADTSQRDAVAPDGKADSSATEGVQPGKERSVTQTSEQMQARPPSSISSIPLQRDSSSHSYRPQVLYDVTSSHRPTSPPPRSQKTSLSNLPSLHDLTRGPSQHQQQQQSSGWTPQTADRTSVSLLAMMDVTSRVHDRLAAGGDTSLTGRDGVPTVQEADEFEDVQVEDGFGGFVIERRRIPRSQSHNVLSNYGKQLEEEREEAAAQHDSHQATEQDATQHTPKSVQSESAAGREGTGASWSRLPGDEPYVSPILIDDVAAQARAATKALKGEQGERARLRTKSLSNKARKQMLNNISQPQLLTTSQRMEHAKVLQKPDASLRRRDIAALQEQITPRTSSRQLPNVARTAATQMQRTPSGNTLRSPRSSPTDYKTESMAVRKNSVASSQMSRSSSFGNRGRADASVNRTISPAQSTPNFDRTRQSPGTPSSERSSQTGLSRFMSRLRSRKGAELPAVIEPFPQVNGADTAANKATGNADGTYTSPVLGSPKANTPGSLATPKFHTPKESPGQITPSPNVAGYAGKLSLPPSNNTPLSEMFANTASPTAAVLPTSSDPAASDEMAASLLAPAAPIHARHARPQINGQDPSSAIRGVLPTVEAPATDGRSARDTIVRRTIIVSTFDPFADERRKSTSTANRKHSLRKPVDRQSQSVQQGGNAGAGTQHHRRTSSLSSFKSNRRSLHDRPPTPPGPDGVSGTHRRKLSQEVITKPLPATARNVYEAPLNTNEQQFAAPSLNVPNAATSRASAMSDYGVSLYDMYIDDDQVGAGDRSRTQSLTQRASGLIPPTSSSSRHASSLRQSVNEANGGGARHIEVTERADGSVVWQVIAGLADRSSTYSASIDYRAGGGGHSRQTSDTSQYSFLRNNPIAGPGSHPNAYADEDGRSLFARTRGKKSFSIDGESVPPLPGMNAEVGRLAEGGGSSSFDQQSATRPSMSSNRSQPQQLDFEMALPPGQAATRIVYTSDADLAGILESLAGPDKSSAKFAFQRVFDESNAVAGQSNEGDPSDVTPKIGAQESDRNSGRGSANRGGVRNGRPVSIWTDEELANDPLGLVRNQRIKIEAEIYSLLQRGQPISDTRPSSSVSGGGERSSALMPPPPIPQTKRSAVSPP